MCCVLVQYPGVAQSIHSDIDNIMGILKLWNILPEGAVLMCVYYSNVYTYVCNVDVYMFDTYNLGQLDCVAM